MMSFMKPVLQDRLDMRQQLGEARKVGVVPEGATLLAFVQQSLEAMMAAVEVWGHRLAEQHDST